METYYYIENKQKNEFNENRSFIICLRNCSYVHRIKALIRDIKNTFLINHFFFFFILIDSRYNFLFFKILFIKPKKN